jgi:nucleotide-binding universal stress UspA family protein
MSTQALFRRVLVALDSSPSSLAALEAAADIAAAVDAELLGLFVEDVELLHSAEHPMTRQVTSFSGALQPLDAEQMRLQLRTLAARARAALAAAGQRSGVRCSFRVRRGTVAAVLLEELAEADVVSLGRVGWSATGEDRLGTTARRLIEESAPASALLARRGRVLGSSVWVLFDGSPEARRALTVGAGLCGDRPLDVVVIGRDEKARERLVSEVKADLAGKGRPPRLHDAAASHPSEALVALRGETIGLLVVPANVAQQAKRGLSALLADVDVPVLIVREAAPPAESKR